MRRVLPIALIAGLVAVATPLLAGRAPDIARAATPTPTATRTPTATPTPAATPPSSLPARFQGSITLFGKKASGSPTLTAYIGNVACGSTKLRAGAFAVNVPAAADMPGCGTVGSAVSFKIGDYWAVETGSWAVGVPQTVDLTGPKNRTDALAQGCNQAVVTFEDKTPVKTLRGAVAPAASLVAVWRWNSTTSMWEGDFPGAPDAVNTLKALNRLDTLWMCVSEAATLTQPALDFN